MDGLEPGRRRQDPDPGPLRQAEAHAAVKERNLGGLGGRAGVLESNRAEREDIDSAPIGQIEDRTSFSAPQYGPVEDREGLLPDEEPAFASVDGQFGGPESSYHPQGRDRTPDGDRRCQNDNENRGEGPHREPPQQLHDAPPDADTSPGDV